VKKTFTIGIKRDRIPDGLDKIDGNVKLFAKSCHVMEAFFLERSDTKTSIYS
jgi:hypothetical protein